MSAMVSPTAALVEVVPPSNTNHRQTNIFDVSVASKDSSVFIFGEAFSGLAANEAG